MPSINSHISPSGPIFNVLVSITSPRREALLRLGKNVPSAVHGSFLFDTGASSTCVDRSVIEKLCLSPISTTNILTPSTGNGHHVCNLYDVSVFIPGETPGAGHTVNAIQVIETDLSSQGISGLIGRDIIDKCVLIYNGTGGIFTLSY